MNEDAFIITGGTPLNGEVTLSGAKNVALKVIIASLLFKTPVTLTNVPRIRDVEELIHLVKNLGAKAQFTDTNTLTIDGTSLTSPTVDMLHASTIRVSFMMFAPLLTKLGKAFIPNPGGCRLGERSIDRIIEGMKAYGVRLTYNSQSGYYESHKDQPINGSYTFEKQSHTGTELLIMLGAINKGEITIHNAATEPEVDHLIAFLTQSGANITKNNGSITIKGVEELTRKEPYAIPSDRNEAVTYAVAGLATKGSVTIGPMKDTELTAFIEAVEKSGQEVNVNGERITFTYKEPLKAVSITTGVHPAFMTDWQPLWAVLMTQAEGTSIIHETLFENRFGYVQELKKLGARIKFIQIPLEDPQKVYGFTYDPAKTYKQAIQVQGIKPLHNGVMTTSDLRAGATLLVAALVAKGESIIKNAHIIERGYENTVEKLTRLGATIKRV